MVSSTIQIPLFLRLTSEVTANIIMYDIKADQYNEKS